MKNFLQQNLVILIAFWVTEGSAQTTTFNWSDTIFMVESKREIELIVDPYGGTCSVYPCYKNNGKVYDTLISFLKTHGLIKIQIASHLDHDQVDSEFKHSVSTREAEYIGRVLVNRGIKADRITTIGYGDSKQIIKEEDISKLPKKERDHARDINTRIEIIITEK